MNRLNYKENLNDCLLVVFLIVFPQLLFIHLFFSETETSLSLLGYSYLHGFPDTKTFMYIVLTTFIPICMLSVWYIKCYYSWNWIILLIIFPWLDNAIRYKYKDKSDFDLFFHLAFFLFLLQFYY